MLLKTGEFESAQAICSDALEQAPEDANFLCLSARVLVRLQRFDQASTQIELALSIFPEFERGFDVRGELLFAQGELPAAAEAFQQAIKINPERQQTRMKLGQVLMRMGRFDEVSALKDEFMELSEDNKDIARAVKLVKEEKFGEAEKIYRDILIREPDNVSAMRLWAGLGVEQKQYSEAEVLLQRAVEKAPDFVRAWNDLWTVQHQQEKYDDAIDTANRLISLDPRAPNARVLLASTHASAGRHPDAVRLFDEALEIAPDHVGALCGKGNSFRTIGNQEGAIAAFRSSIKANPLFAEPYWSLANLKTFRFEESEVDEMLALVGDERITPEGQVQLNNALGLEFDGRKEQDRAFEFIDRGNKLRRQQEFYDPVDNEEMISKTIEIFTQQFLADNAGHGDPESAPIFIVGLPRSGSTLIEQILSSHSQVEGTYELRDLALTVASIPNPRGMPHPKAVVNIDQDMFKKLGAEYIERTRRHRGALPFFTDKNPNNFVHVGLLQLILPNAKIIDARRHPLDSCFGSYKQLFASGQPFTYDLVELGEYYLQYQRMMDHWHEVVPGKILSIQYEEVVADLENQVRRILKHCGLAFEDSCLRFHETNRLVKTASSEQVRQPIYSSSVHTWRGYEPHLSELIEVLEPLLLELPERDRPVSLGGHAT